MDWGRQCQAERGVWKRTLEQWPARLLGDGEIAVSKAKGAALGSALFESTPIELIRPLPGDDLAKAFLFLAGRFLLSVRVARVLRVVSRLGRV
jgi:hypothetical protein